MIRTTFKIGLPLFLLALTALLLFRYYTERLAVSEIRRYTLAAGKLIEKRNHEIDRLIDAQQAIMETVPLRLLAAPDVRHAKNLVVSLASRQEELIKLAQKTKNELSALDPPAGAREAQGSLVDYYGDLALILTDKKRLNDYYLTHLEVTEEAFAFFDLLDTETTETLIENLNSLRAKTKETQATLNSTRPGKGLRGPFLTLFNSISSFTQISGEYLLALETADRPRMERALKHQALDPGQFAKRVDQAWSYLRMEKIFDFSSERRSRAKTENILRRFNQRYKGSLALPKPLVARADRQEKKVTDL